MWFRKHRLALVSGVVAALGALLLIGTVLAETPTPTPTTPGFSFRDAFLGHLAKGLGIEQAQLVEQMKTAARASVDDGAQQGAIPAERAQRLKEQIDEGNGPAFGGKPFGGKPFGGKPFGHGRGHGGFAPGGKLGIVAQWDTVAQKLGLTKEQLAAEVKGGKSLAEVAEARGVSREDLRAALLDALTAQVNQAVQNGRLTQEQADRILATAPTQLDHFIDAAPRLPKRPTATPTSS